MYRKHKKRYIRLHKLSNSHINVLSNEQDTEMLLQKIIICYTKYNIMTTVEILYSLIFSDNMFFSLACTLV